MPVGQVGRTAARLPSRVRTPDAPVCRDIAGQQGRQASRSPGSGRSSATGPRQLQHRVQFRWIGRRSPSSSPTPIGWSHPLAGCAGVGTPRVTAAVAAAAGDLRQVAGTCAPSRGVLAARARHLSDGPRRWRRVVRVGVDSTPAGFDIGERAARSTQRLPSGAVRGSRCGRVAVAGPNGAFQRWRAWRMPPGVVERGCRASRSIGARRTG